MDNPVQTWLLTALKRSLWSGTLILLGALCKSVALSPYSSTGFVPQMSVFTILWPNATTLLPNKFEMLTCDWAPGLMTAGLLILFQPWLVCYKSTCSKKSCGTVNPLISVVLLWTSERDTWSFGHPILMAHESTTAKILTFNIQMVCTAPKKSPGYSFSLQPSQAQIPRPPTRCHSQCCPFQTACPHPSLWDRNMEPQLLPFLWFVWGWWWCPGWKACYFSLHTPPYSVSSQEIWVLILRGKSKGCFYFFAPEQQL